MKLLVASVVSAVLVACTPTIDLTVEEAAAVQAQAVTAACEEACDRLDIYVVTCLRTLEQVYEPMTAEAIEAIAGIRDVQFVTPREAADLFTNDFLVDRGGGVIVEVGPVETLGAQVIGVEVGVVTARDGGHGFVYQFRFDGQSWIPTTSEETGIPSREWVS